MYFTFWIVLNLIRPSKQKCLFHLMDEFIFKFIAVYMIAWSDIENSLKET